MCSDGGPGSIYFDCDLGEDCTDCGPRYLFAPPAAPLQALEAVASALRDRAASRTNQMVVSVAVVLSTIALLACLVFCVFVCFVRSRERMGEPIWKSLSKMDAEPAATRHENVPMAPSHVEMMAQSSPEITISSTEIIISSTGGGDNGLGGDGDGDSDGGGNGDGGTGTGGGSSAGGGGGVGGGSVGGGRLDEGGPS